jgi:hypothetical protein
MTTSDPEVPESNKPNESNGSPRSVIKLPFAQLEPIAKAAVAFIALVYTLGLLVTNRYLVSFGISDFSSLRPRYIFTGTWSLWLIVLATVPGFILFSGGRTFTWRTARNTGLALALITFAFVMTMAALGVPAGLAVVRQFYFLIFLVTTLIVFVALTAAKPLSLFSALPQASGFDRLAVVVLRLGLVVFAATMFVGSVAVLSGPGVYGSIPDGLGGGKPLTATLIFDSRGAGVWEQAGMPLASGSTRNSQKIKIIYQDEHNLYVEGSYMDRQQSKTKTVIIARSLVDVILPEPEPMPPF